MRVRGLRRFLSVAVGVLAATLLFLLVVLSNISSPRVRAVAADATVERTYLAGEYDLFWRGPLHSSLVPFASEVELSVQSDGQRTAHAFVRAPRLGMIDPIGNRSEEVRSTMGTLVVAEGGSFSVSAAPKKQVEGVLEVGKTEYEDYLSQSRKSALLVAAVVLCVVAVAVYPAR